ncbi:hypothetical protein H6P81_005795 [Aristolochia fimbriata]|uniref:Uncharacterized protein n=1 Tax=Aristolochia fimbriata TaxID=158543 RepID=A0AAV7EY91_ARIFI|nr:hypothetical protein H6P81_005795 [Aristolochia fimbriata]
MPYGAKGFKPGPKARRFWKDEIGGTNAVTPEEEEEEIIIMERTNASNGNRSKVEGETPGEEVVVSQSIKFKSRPTSTRIIKIGKRPNTVPSELKYFHFLEATNEVEAHPSKKIPCDGIEIAASRVSAHLREEIGAAPRSHRLGSRPKEGEGVDARTGARNRASRSVARKSEVKSETGQAVFTRRREIGFITRF